MFAFLLGSSWADGSRNPGFWPNHKGNNCLDVDSFSICTLTAARQWNSILVLVAHPEFTLTGAVGVSMYAAEDVAVSSGKSAVRRSAVLICGGGARIKAQRWLA